MMEASYNEQVYNMDHAKRGLAVIINNKDFEERTRLPTRRGTDEDSFNLLKVFSSLGFDVQVHQNRKCTDMLMILDKGLT